MYGRALDHYQGGGITPRRTVKHRRTPKPAAFGNQRSLYDYLKKKYPGDHVVITESYLRSEVVLSNQNTISFNILNNVGTVRPSERRLSQADRFVALTTGFFLMRSSTTANQSSANLMHTFPNANVFPTTEATELDKIYNGYAQFKIGPTTYYDSLDMWQFLRVGVAQQGLATIGTAALPGSSPVGAYSADFNAGVDYGYKSIVPTMEISGLDKTTFDVNLPEPATMAPAAAGVNNVAVLCFRGFLIQNGAAQKPRF
jgi:hypothetical protein